MVSSGHNGGSVAVVVKVVMEAVVVVMGDGGHRTTKHGGVHFEVAASSGDNEGVLAM